MIPNWYAYVTQLVRTPYVHYEDVRHSVHKCYIYPEIDTYCTQALQKCYACCTQYNLYINIGEIVGFFFGVFYDSYWICWESDTHAVRMQYDTYGHSMKAVLNCQFHYKCATHITKALRTQYNSNTNNANAVRIQYTFSTQKNWTACVRLILTTSKIRGTLSKTWRMQDNISTLSNRWRR